jgi:hypothetical protein
MNLLEPLPNEKKGLKLTMTILKYLTTHPSLSSGQCKWVERLQQFDYG